MIYYNECYKIERLTFNVLNDFSDVLLTIYLFVAKCC